MCGSAYDTLAKLKLVDNGETGVVFPQAGFAITDEVAKAAACPVIEINVAKIGKLIIVTNQTAELCTAGVKIFRSMRLHHVTIVRMKIPISAQAKVGIDASKFI